MNGQVLTQADTDCLPSETIRDYLGGWSDSQQSALIEQHLLSCELCERKIVGLETTDDSADDSLVGQLQKTSAAPDLNLSKNDSMIEAAIRNSQNSPWEQSQAPRLEFPDQVGPYDLLNPIGSGGMGAVFLARHRDLGKRVAIKLVAATNRSADQRFERFVRETRAAGALSHPAIVNATDAGREGSVQFLAMEFIDGLDLSRICRSIGRLPVADACQIIRVAATALAYAHGEGVVHRDIKPSNLMIDREGQIKLLDFGLARVSEWDEASAELTTVGQLMGTLDYMSPEQAERPDAADYRSDIYSLGATLFRLIAGRPPLAATPNLSPLAKLRLLSDHDPPKLDTLRDDVPQPLVAQIALMLDRNPEQRPASASHVAESLTEFTTGHALKSLVARAGEETKYQHASDSRASNKADMAQPAGDAGTAKTGRRKAAWIATAFLPIALFAGVMVTLETQKGQLVIDSEVEDVSVKLLKDGKTYKDLKITTGANATRLFAGSYEVVIGAGSDSIIEGDSSLTIMRGETTITQIKKAATGTAVSPKAIQLPRVESPVSPGQRIRVESAADAGLNMTLTVMNDHTIKARHVGVVFVEGLSLLQIEEMLNSEYEKHLSNPGIELFFEDPGPSMKPTSSTAETDASSALPVPTIGPSEPVYHNKNLQQWLAIIRYERHDDELNAALVAVQNLVSTRNTKEIKQLCVDHLLARVPVAQQTYRTLQAILPFEQFVELLTEQIQSDEPIRRHNALAAIDPRMHDERIRDLFFDWIDSTTFDKELDQEIAYHAFDLACRYIEATSTDLASKNKFIKLATTIALTGKVKPTFWLERNFEEAWGKALKITVAKQVIISKSKNDTDLTAAAYTLSQNAWIRYGKKVDSLSDPEFVSGLKFHLDRLSVEPNVDLTCRISGVKSQIQNFLVTAKYESKPANTRANESPAIPSLDSPVESATTVTRVRDGCQIRSLHCDSNVGTFSPLIQTLNLIGSCENSAEFTEELQLLNQQTLKSFEAGSDFFEGDQLERLELKWPGLEFATGYSQTVAPKTSEPLKPPTRQQWFEFLIHQTTQMMLQDIEQQKKDR